MRPPKPLWQRALQRRQKNLARASRARSDEEVTARAAKRFYAARSAKGRPFGRPGVQCGTCPTLGALFTSATGGPRCGECWRGELGIRSKRSGPFSG